MPFIKSLYLAITFFSLSIPGIAQQAAEIVIANSGNKEPNPVTIGPRKFVGNLILGVKRASQDLKMSPEDLLGQEFAQLIRIPKTGDEVYKIKKVILPVSGFHTGQPVLLHIYSVEELRFPGKDLLQKTYLITAGHYNRGKIIVDLSAENVYIDQPAVFVGFEYPGNPSTATSRSPFKLHITLQLNEQLTYIRSHRSTSDKSWDSWRMSLFKNRDTNRGVHQYLNTMFTIEVEKYK